MHAKYLVILIFVTCSFVPSCDNELTNRRTFDQTWHVTYYIDNQTPVDVFVVAAGACPNYCDPGTISYRSGERAEFGRYSAFLSPPPDPGRDFICISLYRESDSLLIYQLGPVSKDDWSRKDPRSYHAEFTLILRNEDINVDGIDDSCGRLQGHVMDKVASTPIEHAGVVYTSVESNKTWTRTNEEGFYVFTWSDSIPAGSVEIRVDQNRRAMFSVPEDVTIIRDRLFRLDVNL